MDVLIMLVLDVFLCMLARDILLIVGINPIGISLVALLVVVGILILVKILN